MEFWVKRDCFYKAISDVSRAISLKTTIPILTGIQLIASEENLTLVGSNSDIFIETNIPMMINNEKVLEIFETGSVVVSARFLIEIVKKLPDDVHVKINDKKLVTIKSDGIVTTLNGFYADEYPKLPRMDEVASAKIPSSELIELIKQTTFAVSRNETKPVLTGLNLLFQEKQLTCAGTNSHRLAIRKLPIEATLEGSYIVPGTSLNELSKIMQNESGHIHIYITECYIIFKTNSLILYSRLIEGIYPNVIGLIPKDTKTVITIGTAQLLKGVDRASLFATEGKNNRVNIKIEEGKKLRISSNSTEVGKIEELQNLKVVSGQQDLSISFDGRFLIDALKAIKEEEIQLSFGGSMRPVIIEPIGNPNFLQLISPVRTY
ncbi:DNA polymerase III subunit beta [Robertmurraya yapensis]|uniref:Beta sliding clamp n=2 Tax=Bacillaceae TaxID=186817 RepID=A0A431WKA1_9BACI|nr:DNA polymerase III subunit beta [Bacillus yapensis]RTR35783.1 DNA polymerase III subunit beta [Bacillus yapensis]TKS98585.1 DNA polymerase III subunit beta [Bacillus yapensis]